MKKFSLSIAAASFLMAGTATAQDLSQRQVPTVIVNEFQKAFPKARDIEWEMDRNLYDVEFEVGWTTDHEIWYDSTGKMIRHEEDISKKDLPAKVKTKLKSDFDNYRVSDAKKTTTESKVIYSMELNSFSKELEISFDEKGNILSKNRD